MKLTSSHLIAIGLALWTLGTTVAKEPRIPLRVSNLPHPNQTDPVQVATLRAVDRFEALNPDVELQSAQGIYIEGMVSEVSTLMMVAGDIAPDVIHTTFRSLDTFVSKGILAPLDPFLAADPTTRNSFETQIPQQVQDVVYRPGPDGQRHLYGLPSQFTVRGFYYNRELFRRAGLPQRAPKDWKELLEFGKKISALGPEYHGIYLLPGPNAAWDLISFLWSAGGEAVEEVAPNQWRATFDTEEAVSAYLFYYEMVEADRIVIRATDITPQQRKNVGMFFGRIGDSVTWNPERFAFGAVPRGPTGIRGSEINAQILSIFSGIKDPKVRDAAWRYISFMTGPEAESIRIRTLVALGQASQVNPLSLRRQGFEKFLALTPPGLEEEIEESIKSGKPEPYGRNCNLIYQEMTRPLDQILLSEEIRQAWLRHDLPTVRLQIKQILEQAVKQTNERMIGYVPPEIMQHRRRVAGLVLAGICATLIGTTWYLAKAFTRSSRLMATPVSSRSLIPWLCLFPAVSLIFVWNYIPLFRGSLMAFQNYELILESSYVGLDNFASALFDPTFWSSLLATFHFAAYTLSLGFAAPILLAYALHLIPKHKVFYRTVYYLPAIMSSAAIFFLWRELFGVDGQLNEVLRFFGWEARRAWTEDPYLAMLSCVLPGIWAGAGPGCLIYLAALKTIPEEQFEAAEIDGAGFLQMTAKIVFPGLRPLIFINLIGAIAATFHGATNILIMTGGGPNGLTEVVSLKIFYEAFTRLRFGPATAMAWIIGSMLVGITVIQLKRLSEMEFKTAR